jgi:hypothetical protein
MILLSWRRDVLSPIAKEDVGLHHVSSVSMNRGRFKVKLHNLPLLFDNVRNPISLIPSRCHLRRPHSSQLPNLPTLPQVGQPCGFPFTNACGALWRPFAGR